MRFVRNCVLKWLWYQKNKAYLSDTYRSRLTISKMSRRSRRPRLCFVKKNRDPPGDQGRRRGLITTDHFQPGVISRKRGDNAKHAPDWSRLITSAWSDQSLICWSGYYFFVFPFLLFCVSNKKFGRFSELVSPGDLVESVPSVCEVFSFAVIVIHVCMLPIFFESWIKRL